MSTTTLQFTPISRISVPFFEIDEAPVLYEKFMRGDGIKRYPDKKVIINNKINEGISIVKTGFLSVAHKQAFDLGVELFEMMFGATPQIHKELINSSTTDYSVDLVSENCKIVFDSNGYRYLSPEASSDRPNFEEMRNHADENMNNAPLADREIIAKNFYDEYFPFIRVSNYLREGNSFYIELGYYRYRCSNGMMLGRKTKMTFRHSYYVKDFNRIKEAAINQFISYKRGFLSMADKLWRLLSVHIPKDQMRLVVFDILEKELITRRVAERKKLQFRLNDLTDMYVREIGENLNAALNVATDASKLLESSRVSQSKIQNLATTWINRVAKEKFTIDSYLEEIQHIEERVLTAKEVAQEEEDMADF